MIKYICVSDIAKIHGYTQFTDFLWYISKYATLKTWGDNWCNLEIASNKHASLIEQKIRNFQQIPLKSCIQYYLDQGQLCRALRERSVNKEFATNVILKLTEKEKEKDGRFAIINTLLQQSKHPFEALIYALEEPVTYPAANLFIQPAEIVVPDNYFNIIPISLSGAIRKENQVYIFRSHIDQGKCSLHLDVLLSFEKLNLWTGSYLVFISDSDYYIQKMTCPDFLAECKENKIERPEVGVYSAKYAEFQKKFTMQDVPDVSMFLDMMNDLNYQAYLNSLNNDNIYIAGDPEHTRQKQNKECNVRGHYRKLKSGKVTYVTPHKRIY